MHFMPLDVRLSAFVLFRTPNMRLHAGSRMLPSPDIAFACPLISTHRGQGFWVFLSAN